MDIMDIMDIMDSKDQQTVLYFHSPFPIPHSPLKRVFAPDQRGEVAFAVDLAQSGG